ncbi:MAG TPA: ABC transporter permease, partial [Vicinamibacterales bacterium]|nr:ABC transporter permease [Vicinamibacterales bacterium]
MNKIFIVAHSEFSMLVRTKAFVVTLILMPVLMGASIGLSRAARNATDTNTRRFAYIDRSGVIAPALEAAAAARNATANASGQPRYEPVAIDPSGKSEDELRLELSDRVRSKEIYAFVEIPGGVMNPDQPEEVRYYSNAPSYQALPQWLRTTIGAVVVSQRFQAAAVDPSVVERLIRPTAVNALGLLERDESGKVKPPEKVDQRMAAGVPAGMLVLMYLIVMASAPQLLNTVIEEKMSRISEVLIGSVSPFELMMGKLLGCVGVSLLLAAVYLAGSYGVASYWGMQDAITPTLAAWFLLFLTMAVLMFGAIFIAVGAACSDLKDSQSMMMPVMMLIMFPVFTFAFVMRAPDGNLALALS